VESEATGAGHVEIESCTRNLHKAGPAARPRGPPPPHTTQTKQLLKGRDRHGTLLVTDAPTLTEQS
jgi:hypothetical protein